MTTPQRPPSTSGTILVAGIVLATLTEAIASTILSLGRIDLIGDTYATPDEFAWLDVCYIALKMTGFLVAPWLMSCLSPRSLMTSSTLLMGAACAFAAVTVRLDLLVGLRLVQGVAGGILLVAGQTIVFLGYSRRYQPMLQALFAVGAVVAPATLAPALQGWLLDSGSWSWIFFSVVPVALAAAGLVLLADIPKFVGIAQRPFDWIGISLLATALFCFTYVLSQGSRWNWFEASRISWLAIVGAAALLAFLGQQLVSRRDGLLDFTIFQSNNFAFALIVSLVAGAALFGSAYLIPSFALSVLAFTPMDAGQLLLPSGAPFAGALFVAAYLIQFRRVPPIATVPFGIMMVMSAMWMLSGSSGESGSDDMMAAILLRGCGLGFLFLSITMIAFSDLDGRNLACGIGIFNAGRQFGGLLGVAGLQTIIDRNIAADVTILGAHVSAGDPTISERIATTSALLVARGMDATASSRAATNLLNKAIAGQSAIIAFDTAFKAVALLFVAAVPILIVIKIGLLRRTNADAVRSLSKSADSSRRNHLPFGMV